MATIASYGTNRCSGQDDFARHWDHTVCWVAKHVSKTSGRVTQTVQPDKRLFVILFTRYELQILVLSVILKGVGALD